MNHHEAIRLFTEVSKKYPASVTAQSAALALESKRNRTLTKKLYSMRHDDSAIETISRTAEIIHAQSRNPSAPKYISRVSTGAIIEAELDKVSQMTRLRRSQLKDIIALYGTLPTEEAYEAYVQKKYFPQEPDIYFVKPQ